jgi:hypothetical protein
VGTVPGVGVLHRQPPERGPGLLGEGFRASSPCLVFLFSHRTPFLWFVSIYLWFVSI